MEIWTPKCVIQTLGWQLSTSTARFFKAQEVGWKDHRQWGTTENERSTILKVADGHFSHRSERRPHCISPLCNIIDQAIRVVAQNIKEPDSSRPGYSRWQWRCTLISAQYTILWSISDRSDSRMTVGYHWLRWTMETTRSMWLSVRGSCGAEEVLYGW